jgi:predicted nucleic acid-binding protein
VATFLADKSALARLHVDSVGERLGPLLLSGRVATCAIVDLELGWSARRSSEWEAIMDERRGFPRVAMTAEVCERALEVQGLLAAKGQHRAVPIPDLLVAATAEAAGLVVLYYDADFELVAAVTAQEMEWVVPRGSVT